MTKSPSFPLSQKIGKVAVAAHRALTSSNAGGGGGLPALLGLAGVAKSSKDKGAGLNMSLYEAAKAQRAAYGEAQRLTGVFTSIADNVLETAAASE